MWIKINNDEIFNLDVVRDVKRYGNKLYFYSRDLGGDKQVKYNSVAEAKGALKRIKDGLFKGDEIVSIDVKIVRIGGNQ